MPKQLIMKTMVGQIITLDIVTILEEWRKMGPCLQTSRKRYEDQLLRTWYGTEQKKVKRQLWLEPSHSAFLLKYSHAFLITETKDQLHPSGLPISYV